MNIKTPILLCPVCRMSLCQNDNRLFCSNNHCFDISAKGYVNLLPVNQKKSRDPGDNKEMIDSRRAFLNKEYYKKFSDSINFAAEKAGFRKKAVVLDAGCGEGYYLERLKEYLQLKYHDIDFEFYGIDISKPAINLAATRNKAINFIVGSSYNLPFRDSSIDCIIQVFAPGNMAEYHRVLKIGGKLVTAEPGIEHLYELKEILYKSAIKNEEKIEFSDELTLLETTEIQYQIEISNAEDNKNLIAMTPYFWHVEKSLQSFISTTDYLKTTLHFMIRSFEKTTII